MELNVENAKQVLEKYLKESNPKKYNHSIEVAEIAGQLARKWRVNVEEAVIAALLHDIGKSIERKDMLSFCTRNNIEITEFERHDNQEALHGKIGAYLFKVEFRDGEDGKRTSKRTMRKIAHAIESHVAGSEEMSLLDKIIFLADDIQSKKGGKKMLEKILAERSRRLGRYIGRIVDRKIQQAMEKGRFPNPGLLNTIAKGTEGNQRRERFVRAIQVISEAPQKGTNPVKTVTLIVPPNISRSAAEINIK